MSLNRDPRQEKHLDEAVLLRAISALKDELVTIINTGITQVQASVSNLQAQQNEHMLLQERRNSTFASRERVETVAFQVATHSGDISRLNQSAAECATDRHDIRSLISSNERTATKVKIENLTKGYAAIGAAVVAIAGVLAQVFFHFWK